MAFDVSTKVTGGKALAGLIKNLGNERQTLKAIEHGMRRELLPRLASGVGRQSGDLAKSFNLKVRGNAIQLTSDVHYSRQAKFTGRNPATTVELAHQIAGRQVERIVRRALQGQR